MITVGGIAYPSGFDVSQWNGDITSALHGQEFCIIRASVAASPDGDYTDHYRTARAAGVVVAAYHYTVYGPGDGRQAQELLASAGNADLLAVDVEAGALRHPLVARGIIAYLHQHDPLHRKVLLYSSEGTWPGNLGQDGNWVANYVRMPVMPWLFWQQSGHGLDRDVFHGTLAQLKTLGGKV